jgi:opacity protein-like surface antigen
MNNLVRTLALSTIVLMATVMPAAAQRLELYGGYQYQHFNPKTGASCSMNGWSSGAQWTWSHIDRANVAVAVDFGGVYGKSAGVSLSHYTYLAGPRVTQNFGRYSLYAHTMIGNAQLSARMGVNSDSTSSFAYDFGGGTEIRLSRHWSVRPVQLDWLGTSHAHRSQNNLRYLSNVAWRF